MLLRAVLQAGFTALRVRLASDGYAELADASPDGPTRDGHPDACRICRGRPAGFADDTYFLVVSNNLRNRALESALAVRFTTSPKPTLASIVSLPSGEVLPAGRLVCDDIYELSEDEITADMGALTPATMRAVDSGLTSALALT